MSFPLPHGASSSAENIDITIVASAELSHASGASRQIGLMVIDGLVVPVYDITEEVRDIPLFRDVIGRASHSFLAPLSSTPTLTPDQVVELLRNSRQNNDDEYF